jgi:hypothetical protein
LGTVQKCGRAAISEILSVAKRHVKEFRMDELPKRNSSLVKETYAILMGDVEMQKCFLECSAQMAGVTEDMKMKIWRDLVSKTYHAQIGVIADRFGDDTTGRYSAKTKNHYLWRWS